MVLHTGDAKWEGCVSKCALCVVCGASVVEGRLPVWRRAAAVQGCPGRLAALPDGATKVLAGPGPWAGIDEASTWAAKILQHTATLQWAAGSGDPSVHRHMAMGSGCSVVWCGVVWCGVVWCGVVWCGVVWCGVVWCGVVWCGGVC